MPFKTIDQFTAVVIRCFLIFHNLLLTWRLKEAFGDSHMWLMALTNLAIILEGLYFVYKRNGKELKWISPLFVIFLLCEIPSIWLLELNRFDKASSQELGNITVQRNITSDMDIVGKLIGNIFTADTWVLMLEETTLYTLIIARWLLPRGELSRAMLSEVLLIYVGLASDVMEFFSLVSEDHIRTDIQVTYAVLGVWSASCFQFTYTIVLSRKKTRSGGASSENEDTLAIELISVILSLIMQDGPFLCVRLYVMIRFRLLRYSIVFFVIKNVIVVLFLAYRLAILCVKIKNRQGKSDTEKIVPIVNFDVLQFPETVRKYEEADHDGVNKVFQVESELQGQPIANYRNVSHFRDASTNTDQCVFDFPQRHTLNGIRKRKAAKLPKTENVVSVSKKNHHTMHECADSGRRGFNSIENTTESKQKDATELPLDVHPDERNNLYFRPPFNVDARHPEYLNPGLHFSEGTRRTRWFHSGVRYSVRTKRNRRNLRQYTFNL